MADQQIRIQFLADMSTFQRSMSTMQRSVTTATQNAESSVRSMGSTFAKIGAGLVGIFAIDKMFSGAVSIIESTADLQAMEAQYSQVFKGVEGEAGDLVDGLAKKFNVLPNRMKPMITGLYSGFKGIGLSSEEAFKMAEQGANQASDASAFYDISIEDANSRLASFKRGNLEAGEAIGLNASASQIAAFGMEEYGINMDTATEAEKQYVRSGFADAVYENNGAVGQGVRESESYANAVGNMKSAWETFKAKIGEPFMEPVIKGLTWLTTKLSELDFTGFANKLGGVKDWIVTNLIPIFSDVAEGLGAVGDAFTNSDLFQAFKDAFVEFVDKAKEIDIKLLWESFKKSDGMESLKTALQEIKDGLQWIYDNGEGITAVLLGLAGAFASFHIMMGISSAISAFSLALGVLRTITWGQVIAQIALNTAMLLNPFVWIAIAIGALIAVGFLLWKNWDAISAFLVKVWNVLKTTAIVVFGMIKDWIVNKFNEVRTKVTTIFNTIRTTLTSIWEGIKNAVGSKVDSMKSAVTSKVESIRSTVSSKFNAVRDAIVNPINTARDKIGSAIDKIKGFFSGLSLKFPKISMPSLPKFTMSGKFSLNPPSVPKLGISWNEDGGLFQGSRKGQVVGLGENHKDEAIVPLSKRGAFKPFASAIASQMPSTESNGNVTITNEFVINATIREDADIQRITQEIQRNQDKAERMKGRVVYGN